MKCWRRKRSCKLSMEEKLSKTSESVLKVIKYGYKHFTKKEGHVCHMCVLSRENSDFRHSGHYVQLHETSPKNSS